MNRIKEVLKERGEKQTWLSEKLGKSYNMVNSYVQNRRQPSLANLFKIANILDVNPSDLINDKRIKLGTHVYHKDIYRGHELMKVIGIREKEIELEGDYSGGTHNVCQKDWENKEGILFKQP